MKHFDEKGLVDSKENGKVSLPPRSEIHKEKKKRTKFKIQYPVIRMLALLFVLLPIAILSYLFKAEQETVSPINGKKSSTFDSFVYEKDEPQKELGKETNPEEVSKHNQENSSNQPKSQKETEKVENPAEVETKSSEQKQPATIDTDNTAVSDTTNKQEKPKDQYEIKYHKVKADETLYSVSIKYYQSRSGEGLIKRWNDIKGETIIEGQVLRIPIKIN